MARNFTSDLLNEDFGNFFLNHCLGPRRITISHLAEKISSAFFIVLSEKQREKS